MSENTPPILPNDEQARHREAVSALLGTKETDTAWAEGRAMTLEQAIAYALEVVRV